MNLGRAFRSWARWDVEILGMEGSSPRWFGYAALLAATGGGLMGWGRSRGSCESRDKCVLDAREQGGDEGVRGLVVLVLLFERVE
jgi:hypothetical protein